MALRLEAKNISRPYIKYCVDNQGINELDTHCFSIPIKLPLDEFRNVKGRKDLGWNYEETGQELKRNWR